MHMEQNIIFFSKGFIYLCGERFKASIGNLEKKCLEDTAGIKYLSSELKIFSKLN